jgi:phenylacetate-coenzyme A ligase PaaK-like adenylate-forming protein
LAVPESSLVYVFTATLSLFMQKPLVYIGFDIKERDAVVEVLLRAFTAFGLRFGDSIQLLSHGFEPFGLAFCSSGTGMSAYLGPSVEDHIGYLAIRLELAPQEAPRTLATARLTHPRGIVADFAHLSALEVALGGESLSSLGYEILIIRSSSPVPMKEKKALTKRGGAEVFEILEVQETLFYAADCSAHKGFHIDEDLYFVEILGGDGRAMGERKEGSLTITPLFYESLPMIRYQSGLLGRIERGPCPCGSTQARFFPKG